jgi:hypothetical protein
MRRDHLRGEPPRSGDEKADQDSKESQHWSSRKIIANKGAWPFAVKSWMRVENYILKFLLHLSVSSD